MDLIALCCKKCGSPLNFDKSLICKCLSCGVSNALVGSDGSDLLHSVSFLPYVVRTDGKMDVSLKLQLVDKVRGLKGYVPSDLEKSEHYYMRVRDDHETVECKYFVTDDDEPFVVSMSSVYIHNEIEYTGFFGNKKVETPSYLPRCSELFKVGVVPVMVRDGENKILAGHRVVIRVCDPRYEEEANSFSAMIQEWYQIVPEVTLEAG